MDKIMASLNILFYAFNKYFTPTFKSIRTEWNKFKNDEKKVTGVKNGWKIKAHVWQWCGN